MSYSYDRSKAAGNYSKYTLGLTSKAFDAVWKLDEKFIGTTDYMGIAYFWNTEYKFEMRDASPAVRQKVHATFLRAGLALDGVSPKHADIIKKLAG